MDAHKVFRFVLLAAFIFLGTEVRPWKFSGRLFYVPFSLVSCVWVSFSLPVVTAEPLNPLYYHDSVQAPLLRGAPTWKVCMCAMLLLLTVGNGGQLDALAALPPGKEPPSPFG
jgi:ABC-type polysaccharide/polyol phosphate export permease